MKAGMCRTRFWQLVIAVCLVAAGGVLFGAQPASAFTANVCMQTNYTAHGKTQSLNCTANDVRVAEVTNITIQSGGECHLVNGVNTCTCTANQPVTFTADYKVVLTAQARYDIGIYFSTDGDTNGDGALTGQCKLTTLTATNSDNFVNLDTGADGGNRTHNLSFTKALLCR